MIALWQDRHTGTAYEDEACVSLFDAGPDLSESRTGVKNAIPARLEGARSGKCRTGEMPGGGSEFRMQQTVGSVLVFKGTGLHSGAPVELQIQPAPENTGLQFRRLDVVTGDPEIQGRFDMVRDTMLCTKISNDEGTDLGTVEHLLSALRACEIDNALITIDGPEVPILDGSSLVFFEAIVDAGVQRQSAPRQVIKIVSPVRVGDATCGASLLPAEGFQVEFKIDFESDAIGEQDFNYILDASDYKKEIASARTFGFLRDVEKLRSMGLARGGSLDNAVVIKDGKVLNPEGLRFDDEFVRHKILDVIGDLYLAGLQIEGKYVGHCSGHRVNNDLLRALFDAPDAWTLAYQYEPEVALQAEA